jgi:hypothetical protein
MQTLSTNDVDYSLFKKEIPDENKSLIRVIKVVSVKKVDKTE